MTTQDPKQEIVDLVKSVIPHGNRLIVRVYEKEKVVQGGIATAQPKRGEDETLMGVVLAVGKGYTAESGEFLPTVSKVDDRILLDRMSGITIRIDRQGKIYPFSEEVTDDRLPIRILRQESVLFTFPPSWPF